MCQLVESIYLKDGIFRNLSYHEKRVKSTRQTLFSYTTNLSLQSVLASIQVPSNGLFKCRVLYDQEVRSIQFHPYQIHPVASLKLVEDNNIDYTYKYCDRNNINNLYAKKDNYDDVLIIKKGLVTDTSYANIIFRRKDTWFTPTSCLLNGTMRSYLIDNGSIKEASITKQSIGSFESFKLINAMVGFDLPEVSIRNIFE
jgi:4-amino-4-deoxychorismate lyase